MRFISFFAIIFLISNTSFSKTVLKKTDSFRCTTVIPGSEEALVVDVDFATPSLFLAGERLECNQQSVQIVDEALIEEAQSELLNTIPSLLPSGLKFSDYQSFKGWLEGQRNLIENGKEDELDVSPQVLGLLVHAETNIDSLEVKSRHLTCRSGDEGWAAVIGEKTQELQYLPFGTIANRWPLQCSPQ